MTVRVLNIRRALLQALKNMPQGILMPTHMLFADARRLVLPAPTAAELEEELQAADDVRLITGITTDEGTKWKLSDAGRAWLAEHP